MDEPPRCSVNEPVDRSQNRAFRYRLPALYKLFRLLFECVVTSGVVSTPMPPFVTTTGMLRSIRCHQSIFGITKVVNG